MEAIEPRLAVRTDIAGNWVAIAAFGHKAGGVLLAVQVAHEAADGGYVGGDGVIARQQFGDGLGADIDRDMFVEQALGDPQVDVGGNVVRGVIGGAYDTAGGRCAKLAESFAHDPKPRSC
jgi:hypothetical protein